MSGALTPEDRERLDALFERGAELPPAEHAAFVARECGSNAALRDKLAGLLEGLAGEDRLSRIQPWQSLRIGTEIGRYKLLERVGEGGMGEVYAAEQREPVARRVALKVIKAGMDSAQVVARFHAERQALARMSHPNIAQVFDAGTTADGRPYFVMEFVAGEPITEYCDRRKLSLGERLELFLRICEGVQHAHQKGIIHRDLKPSNLLVVQQDGRALPKIIDFGVARATSGELTELTLHTMVGQIVGTLDYMSPEQADPSGVDIDTRSDIYSLGVVLYQLASGLLPFERESRVGTPLSELVRTIRETEPPKPSARLRRHTGTASTIAALHGTDERTLVRQLSGDLDWICIKALEKDPARRYPSASELAEDVRRHLAHEPVLAGKPGALYRARKYVRRHRLGVTAALLVAAAATAGAIGTISARIDAERAAEVATRKADEVLRLSAQQDLEDLVSRADELWPAHAENIEPYKTWLRDAQKLADRLPGFEATLAELRARSEPWTEADQAAQRSSHPKLRKLEVAQRRLDYLRKRKQALSSGPASADPTPEQVGLEAPELAQDASSLSALARELVDPERRDFGGEEKGLVLALLAVSMASDPVERAPFRDTLAWALFANARLDDALAEEEQALEECAAEKRANFEGYLKRLEAAVEAESSSEGIEDADRERARLESSLAKLEAEVSARPLETWQFHSSEDRWWHAQLAKLVDELRAFVDPAMGLFSEGTSPEHGWGVKKRLAKSIAMRDGTGAEGEQTRAWTAAMPAIRAAYPGLALTPQLGLVPIGPDPESKLWEFAHLETGEPAVRGADGKLVLKEETGLVFVLLPGGTFLMGAQRDDPSQANYDPRATADEGPPHRVTLSPFFLSKYEMTQGQWLRFAGNNPSEFAPDGYQRKWNRAGRLGSLLLPVEGVIWATCVETLARLALTLPSEAQWEYACRGGTSSVYWCGDAPSSLQGVANLADAYGKAQVDFWSSWESWLDDGHTVPAQVGSFRANAFGLHDVYGNVFEWCLDGFDLYSGVAATDPMRRDPAPHAGRVVRGGSFNFASLAARSSKRGYNEPADTDYCGLRPARALRLAP